MVCIPCIILPVALWIYAKFVQPLILRWMPPTWRTWLDSWLYPTCPIKPPPSKSSVKEDAEQKEEFHESENGELKDRNVGDVDDQKSCCRIEEKSPLSTLEKNGQIIVGGPDKKND